MLKQLLSIVLIISVWLTPVWAKENVQVPKAVKTPYPDKDDLKIIALMEILENMDLVESMEVVKDMDILYEEKENENQ